MKLQRDEWYPYFYPADESDSWALDVPLSLRLATRLANVCKEFEAVQHEVAEHYYAGKEKAERAHARAADIDFVQRQRPWWSERRCAALVDSRTRRGAPIRRAVVI
jgi:hypothetical protein